MGNGIAEHEHTGHAKEVSPKTQWLPGKNP